MDKITLELSPGEAILALGAIDAASAGAMRIWRQLVLTNAPSDEQDAAKVSAQILSRVAARLTDTLYPPCWFQECERTPVAGTHWCRSHTPVAVAV